ncbi:MAG TPA: contractile injection system tape measure protein [Mucilaginibacter sp.]
MKNTSPGNVKGLSVNHAGIVLANSYIPSLFERTGLTTNGKFPDSVNQHRAVCYLQFMVTGMDNIDNNSPSLSKLLCGLSPLEVINEDFNIPEEHIHLINGLITAMIGYWPAIGRSSIDGFRGNWFERDGVLSQLEDKWELTVTKRAYDILLSKSPFSFSIIKYAWMDKPLHVQWVY